MKSSVIMVLFGVVLFAACQSGGGNPASPSPPPSPASSSAVPSASYDPSWGDLERVKQGMAAPDFSLEDEAGAVRKLSDYRGKKNVVLVFYRGYF